MEDKRLLSNDELEMVVGGLEMESPYKQAIDTAEREIKAEMVILNSDSGCFDTGYTSGAGEAILLSGRISARNHLLAIYGDLMSGFARLDAIFNPTAADIRDTFSSDYISGLRDRPREIMEEFKSAVNVYN